MASTRTLYSFRNEKKTDWLHTTDHEILQEITQGQFIAVGKTVLIEGELKKIVYVGCEVLAMEGNHTNENHKGNKYPYSVQCIVTYED